LKQALCEVYRGAVAANCAAKAEQDLLDWISWARRCRLRSISTRNSIEPLFLGVETCIRNGKQGWHSYFNAIANLYISINRIERNEEMAKFAKKLLLKIPLSSSL
jgi:hypothetical protein